MSEKCEVGCNHFYGGEIRHDKNCVFYPESRTEMYDKVEAERDLLRRQLKKAMDYINDLADNGFEKARAVRDEIREGLQ